ncbi:hypothetical protein S245_068853 [Arachis hypogaea]
MELRRRHVAAAAVAAGESLKIQKPAGDSSIFPLYLTNAVSFGAFFSVAYFLLHRWREKIRTSTPLHVITADESAAIALLVASAVYLFRFFGIGLSRASVDDDLSDEEIIAKEDGRTPGPCPAAISEETAVIPSPIPAKPCLGLIRIHCQRKTRRSSRLWFQAQCHHIPWNQSLETVAGRRLFGARLFRG